MALNLNVKHYFAAHAYIAADWTTSMRRKFFDDKEAEVS